jgi:hypothetical protein
MIAAFATRKPRVQIPPGPLITFFRVEFKRGCKPKGPESQTFLILTVVYALRDIF